MELEQIAKKHPTLAKKIKSMQIAEKTAKLLIDVQEMPGAKILAKHMTEWIEAINTRLLYEEKMTEQERACLIRERACWEWLLAQFNNQHSILKRIDNFKSKYD